MLNNTIKLPEVVVFAGPNGSGKTTITRMAKIEDKIRLRYIKALKLIPALVEICDILHIYDNTREPFRIFKKRKDIFYRWSNKYWSNDDIERLTGVIDFQV